MEKVQKPAQSKKAVKKQFEAKIIKALEVILTPEDKKLKKLMKKSAKTLADAFHEKKEKIVEKKKKSVIPAVKAAARKSPAKNKSKKKEIKK